MNLFYEAKKVLDKDGKVNPLGPYGKQKLTGREIQVYFRRNKVKDKIVKKAVEVALDLGGAMDIAIKAIKDYYGDKVLKSKEVQTALKFANEESFKDSFNMLDEDYRKVIKMYPRDRDWKKLITKHKRAIDSVRKNDKDLPKKVEDELLTWASQAGEVGSKDDAEDFIMSIIDEGTLSEGKNLMPDIQKIVDTKGAAKVGGVMVDMFTASMISQIYGKVNDSNKKKMEKSNISTLVDLAQRMMQKMGDNLEEARITISTPMYNELQKFGLPKLMKKHDAYLNKDETDKNHTTISTPSGRFHKEIQNLIKKNVDKLMKVLDEGKGSDIFKKYGSIINRLSDKEKDEVIELLYTMNTQSGRRYKEAFGKVKELLNMDYIPEGVNLQEGTWEVPDSYPKLVKLNKFLSKPANFKDAQSVHRWHVQADAYFGDDSFSDDIDAYKTTLKGGERSFYDIPKLVNHGKEYLDRMKKYNKIKAGTDLRDVLEKQLSDWTGGVLKFKNHEIVQMPRDWYMKDNPNEKDDKSPVKAKLESVDYHTKVIVEKFKRGKGRLKFKKSPPIKVEGNAVSRAQQAAIAIAKKKKNESIMDSYRKMWESQNLEEKKEFKQSDIDKVAKLTDRNEHTKSLIHIAKSMGDRGAIKKLELIDKMHNEYGHMPKGLMDMRNEVYDDMKKGMEKYSNGKDMYGAT